MTRCFSSLPDKKPMENREKTGVPQNTEAWERGVLFGSHQHACRCNRLVEKGQDAMLVVGLLGTEASTGTRLSALGQNSMH